jgi:hypothetical protein
VEGSSSPSDGACKEKVWRGEKEKKNICICGWKYVVIWGKEKKSRKKKKREWKWRNDGRWEVGFLEGIYNI